MEVFINNNSLLESNSKYIFRDASFIYNPPFAFRTNYFQTNLSNAFNNLYLFKSYNSFETLYTFFLVGFIFWT